MKKTIKIEKIPYFQEITERFAIDYKIAENLFFHTKIKIIASSHVLGFLLFDVLLGPFKSKKLKDEESKNEEMIFEKIFEKVIENDKKLSYLFKKIKIYNYSLKK